MAWHMSLRTGRCSGASIDCSRDVAAQMHQGFRRVLGFKGVGRMGTWCALRLLDHVSTGGRTTEVRTQRPGARQHCA
jgi:hypothetical protein